MSVAEYASWTHEWNRSLDVLDRALLSQPCAEACTRLPVCNPFSKRCACNACGAVQPPPPPPLLRGADSCTLVAVRHIAKTGGVSLREWMLTLERQGRGNFYGPSTWMPYRGRCDGQKRFLHCCDPSDPRRGKQCRTLRVAPARAKAVDLLAAAAATAQRRAAGSLVSAPSSAPSAAPSSSLTMLEFHWPDSAMGLWGEPATFLQMLPRMRPHAMPGCRVVVATVLRDPYTLYPSLQRHQYDAMREYGREALRLRCGCNLTSCDVVGFVRAFPNFQGWRLTSSRWHVPPLSDVGHDLMHAKAARLLASLDLVGVIERLDDFLQLLCLRAGIAHCGPVPHRNAMHFRASTLGCPTPDAAELRTAIRDNAAADVRLHREATARFASEWDAARGSLAAAGQLLGQGRGRGVRAGRGGRSRARRESEWARDQ